MVQRLALAAALIAGLTPVIAAQFPTVPSGTVIGRTKVGVGPSQAIPFSQLIALLLQSTLTIPTLNTNSVVFKGSTSGQATVQAQAVAGTPTLNLPNTSGTIPSSATSPILLDPVTGIVSCPTCATSTSAASPIITSRALGQTLNLSSFTGLVTAGYAAGGDGGGATFKNVGTAAFIDSYITTFTITGGSAYTNGSYFGVILTNTTKPYAIGTATVSGGVVTAVSVAGTPGGLCNVGDQYTTSSIPGGTGFKITVTGCSTPLGSFSDSVGTHFQLVRGPNAFPNILQFGAVGDWSGSDASATDNFNAIQAAAWFVSYMNQNNAGNGGFWGGRLLVPQGSFKVCGGGSTSLIVPNGVVLEGASNQGSVLKMCDTFSGTVNFMELCDPNWHFACLNSAISNIQLMATRSAAATGLVAMVHSRSTQDFGGIYNSYIYGGLRTCAWLEHGDGGASTVQVDRLSCSTASASPQVQIGNTNASGLNFGTTLVRLKDVVLGGPSSGGTYQSTSGILIFGGFVDVDGVHCEEMPACVEVNNSASIANGQISIHNVNAGSGAPAPACTGVIQLDSTNTQSNTVVSMVPAGSCTNVITNGVSGGTNFTSTITKPIACTTTCS